MFLHGATFCHSQRGWFPAVQHRKLAAVPAKHIATAGLAGGDQNRL
jgi:hypothetical protein